MRRSEEWLAELQAAVEEGEQSDWEAYALGRGRPERAREALPRIAALLGESDLPSLRARAALLAVDAHPEVLEHAARADTLEQRGNDPAVALVDLFSCKESLAREAGHAGYAELALSAAGLSTAQVERGLGRVSSALDGHLFVDTAAGVARAPDEADVWDRFRTVFAPVLDSVDVRLDPRASVAGMSKALRWPDRIGVIVRSADPAGASPRQRIACLGTTAHELGHVLQWRARADRGLGFLDFFALSPLESETAADVGERLLFEPELALDIAPERPGWERYRAEQALRQVRRARFEIRAYAAALDEPSTLETLWAEEVDPSDPGGWSRDGHGFYTDDPMRRYTYPLAHLRSARLLRTVERPFSASAILKLL